MNFINHKVPGYQNIGTSRVITSNSNPPLENQFIYPVPKGSKLIFFAPIGFLKSPWGFRGKNQEIATKIKV